MKGLKETGMFLYKVINFCFLCVEELINKMTNGFQVVVIDRILNKTGILG